MIFKVSVVKDKTSFIMYNFCFIILSSHTLYRTTRRVMNVDSVIGQPNSCRNKAGEKMRKMYANNRNEIITVLRSIARLRQYCMCSLHSMKISSQSIYMVVFVITESKSEDRRVVEK